MIDLNKKEYLLYNRYGGKNYLTPTEEDGVYKLYTDKSDFLQISYDKNEDGSITYYSVDPDGGPYISRDTKVIPLVNRQELEVDVLDIQYKEDGYYLTINIKNKN